MSTINGNVCVVDGVAVDKVFSNGRQVYGRNLIVRTGEIVNSILSVDGGKLLEFNQGSVMCDKIAVTAGEKLTFHQEQPVDTTYCFRYNWYDADGTYLSRAVQVGKGLFTVTVPANAAALWVSYPNVGRVKVERGTTATDWSPAPEDVLKGAITAPNNLVAK